MVAVLALLAALAAPATGAGGAAGTGASADPVTDPDTVPPAIRAMLDAALAGGNEGEIATIVKYARAADPASGDAVQALAQRWRDARLAANESRVRQASFLALWTGKAELGGWLTTGNSDTGGVTATVSATREGLNWRQKFHAQLDYQETGGATTRDHLVGSWEPNYKLSPRAYLYGQAEYERDRFLGYDDRFSGSVGAGYSAIKTPRVQLDLEAGPAYRYSLFTDDTARGAPAARGSLDFKWKLTNGVSIGDVASAYGERYGSSVTDTASLTARLFGPLSAQLSYNVQYESRPAAGAVTTDTTSRAGLTYSF